MDSSADVDGIVLYSGSLLGRAGPGNTDGFELRVVLRPHAEGVQKTIYFWGHWAAKLVMIEPGDGLTVQSAEFVSTAELRVRAGSPALVAINRGGQHVYLDDAEVRTGNIPAWFRPPSVRKVGGMYQYLNYLSKMRDDLDTNLYAVVWENRKPGPEMNRGVAVKNLIVVDRSYEHVTFTDWMVSSDLPQYSLQLRLHIFPEDLKNVVPFLAVGDVIRVHRFRCCAKLPRYMNIMQQKYSSLVVFKTPESGSEVQHEAVTDGEHTMTEADRQHVRQLQQWIRNRLSRETVSTYLVNASDMAENSFYDLVVQVLGKDYSERVLLASDGSTENKLRIYVGEHVHAGTWLLTNVEPGHWLKLRGVCREDPQNMSAGADSTESSVPDNAICLKASPDKITKLPAWCLDVVQRAQRMEERGIIVPIERPPVTAQASSGEVRIDSQAPTERPPIAAQASSGEVRIDSQAPTERPPIAAQASSGEMRTDSVVGGLHADTIVDAEDDEVRTPMKLAATASPFTARPAAPSSSSAAPHETRAVVRAAESEPRVRQVLRFTTAYGDAVDASPIREMQLAAENGGLCHIIGSFAVVKVETIHNKEAVKAEDLICASCCTCNHCFMWCKVSGGFSEVHEAKRRKHALPCGHWLFNIVFKFLMHLRDVEDGGQRLSVSVFDDSGKFFGDIAPEQAASDSAALQRLQTVVGALLRDFPHQHCLEHALTVVRMDTPAYGGGAYLACDSKIELVDVT